MWVLNYTGKNVYRDLDKDGKLLFQISNQS